MVKISDDEVFRRQPTRLDQPSQRKQAGYFVARAAVAAVSPLDQVAGGSAWQAAMSSRMARTCESIEAAEDTTGTERQFQYRILSEFLDS